MKKIDWNIPVFPEEEGIRRYGQIRQAMEKEGIDCLVIAGIQGNYGDKSGNFRYVSNYVPWFDDEYVLFPRKGGAGSPRVERPPCGVVSKNIVDQRG